MLQEQTHTEYHLLTPEQDLFPLLHRLSTAITIALLISAHSYPARAPETDRGNERADQKASASHQHSISCYRAAIFVCFRHFRLCVVGFILVVFLRFLFQALQSPHPAPQTPLDDAPPLN